MYPPVQNFIQVLEKDQPPVNIYVFTTKGVRSKLKLFETGNKKIRIIRMGKSGVGMNMLRRLWNYCFFFTGSFFYLLIKRPKRILYYETISSFPVWLYRRFINKKTAILIHYHEYTSPQEYQSGMWLTKVFHHREKWLYPRAKWVSHTNENRMKLFETDIAPVKITNPFIVPNYPPKAWYREAKGNDRTPTLRIVYIGALSLDTMYTKEFAQWVKQKNGEVTWHIYSNNILEEVQAFLKEINSPDIIIKNGLGYDELPAVLKEYDIGVILYKGHIPNYIYNAPNKLFEYLACGLDVWYPGVMKEIDLYETVNSFPKVLKVDFDKLDSFNLQIALNKEGLTKVVSPFFCEDAFASLATTLCD